jgi:hypothetical protein
MIPPSGTVTTYTAYSAAVIAALKARFGVQTDPPFRFGEYELDDELSGEADSVIATPALLLEVEQWDAEDTGAPDTMGRRPRRFVVNVHCLLGFETPRLQAALRELSLEVDDLLFPAAATHTRRRGADWGLGPAVEPAERSGGQKGGFRPGLHGIDSWIVSFEQVVYLA